MSKAMDVSSEMEPECTLEISDHSEAIKKILAENTPNFEFVEGSVSVGIGMENFIPECQPTIIDPVPLYSVTEQDKEPHACNICQKAFGLKGNLITHMKIHSGVKPYKCDVCEKSFTMKCSWQRHLMLHADERPLYDCAICKKTFTQKYHLGVHMRSHTGEKPYTCCYCEKKFTQKGNLQVHIRSHKGEFTCEVCQLGCCSEYVLARHMFTHTGTRPYACEYCEWNFTQMGTLKRHVKRVHRNVAEKTEESSVGGENDLKNGGEGKELVDSENIVDINSGESRKSFDKQNSVGGRNGVDRQNGVDVKSGIKDESGI